MKKLLMILVAVLTLSLTACSPDQLRVLTNITEERIQHNQHALWGDWYLGMEAQLHAWHMASSGTLVHSASLSSGIREGWKKLGENVGVGPDLESVLRGFENSPAHARNLNDPSYTHMGTGVAYSPDGRVWVVQRFAQY